MSVTYRSRCSVGNYSIAFNSCLITCINYYTSFETNKDHCKPCSLVLLETVYLLKEKKTTGNCFSFLKKEGWQKFKERSSKLTISSTDSKARTTLWKPSDPKVEQQNKLSNTVEYFSVVLLLCLMRLASISTVGKSLVQLMGGKHHQNNYYY